jgi:hypothetical protein
MGLPPFTYSDQPAEKAPARHGPPGGFFKLAGGITQALHNRGHCDVSFLPTFRRAWDTDLRHAGTNWAGTVDEGRAASGTAWLPIVVSEENAFHARSIDVRRLVSHHATIVVADVLRADVVIPDDQDVGFLDLRLGMRWHANLEDRREDRQRHMARANSKSTFHNCYRFGLLGLQIH